VPYPLPLPTAAVQFVRHSTPRHFLDIAEGFLLEAEAENNLILGLAREFAEREPPADPPPFFASVQDDGRVVGCLFRTPPLKVGLTRMPGVAIPLVVRAVADAYPDLPGVLGPLDTIQDFATVWASVRSATVTPGMKMGLYAAESVRSPEPPVPGGMREAGAADGLLLRDWLHRFTDEARIGPPDVDEEVEALVAGGGAFLWEDDGVVSMAAAKGATPNGIRIGYVYTPPMHRQRGYASALVSQLTRHLLDQGRAFCVLYTDLDNPTSNELYQRIGYERVATAGDIHFSA